MTSRVVTFFLRAQRSYTTLGGTHPLRYNDLVFVRDLSAKAVTGVDAWKRLQPQPINISVYLGTTIAEAGVTDDLGYSLNYAVVSQKISELIDRSTFKNIEDIAEGVAKTVLSQSVLGQWARVHVRMPKALLRAAATEIIVNREKATSDQCQSNADNKRKEPSKDCKIAILSGTTDIVKIHNLQLATIIGVNAIERLHKQNVVIDLDIHKSSSDIIGESLNTENFNYQTIVEQLSEYVEAASFKTVEAFVTSVANLVCSMGVEEVTIRAEKPSAITFAEAAGVEITRSKSTLSESFVLDEAKTGHKDLTIDFSVDQRNDLIEDKTHNVFIAFGSNMGDTISNIEKARDALIERGVEVLRTSSLYQSEPMFLKDQQKFINGVFHVSTKLKPLELLKAIKDIEFNVLNRVKVIDNGPRPIDLDILLYDDLIFNHKDLNIPHIGMLSRSFVLQPLIELVPSTFYHPLTQESFHSHLEQLPDESDTQKSSKLQTIIPLPGGRSPLIVDPLSHSRRTEIMAIINTTPDSFSDGGVVNMDNIVSLAENFIKQGATILDIGGISTNPDASDPGLEEELNRVIPAIKILRQCESLKSTPISIDTYRAEVAQAAISAGADIINDVSAGTMSPNMFEVARKTKAPIILNHMRGTPETMKPLANYTSNEWYIQDNSDDVVVDVVGSELEERIKMAMDAGLSRWQIILDPGIGFSKNKAHNLALIRKFEDLRARESLSGFVWLVGPSRKRFIGHITGKTVAKDRVFGTAAAVSALVGQGADIIRVHDVAEMADVIKTADAIYRNI